jgi:hypothetical protein
MSEIVYEPSQTTHWKNLFPNKMQLLGSQNLNEGEELIAEIHSVSTNEIKNKDGKTEIVPILTFTNAPPMVLNITNTRSIASLYGERYDQWAGKSIQVFAVQVKAFGQVGMALRVREVIPQTKEDLSTFENKINSCKTLDELKNTFTAIPKHLKTRLIAAKDKRKGELNAN